MAQQSTTTNANSIVPPKARSKPIATPPAKAGAGKGEAAKGKPRKKAGFAAGFFVCLLIFALGIGGLGAAIWFDLGGLKTIAVTTLRLSETEFLYLENRQNELAATEASLADQNKQVTSMSMAVDQREQALVKSEADLVTRQSELDELADSLGQQQASLDDVVSIYEAMEPAQAAAILSAAADIESNLPIFKHMNQSKLALILAEMSASQASEILDKLTGDAS